MAISSFKKGPILKWWKRPNFKRKFTKIYQIFFLKYHKMMYVLLKFSQNRPKKILFSSWLKKSQEKAKWTNHFISRKLFQKRPNSNPGWHNNLGSTNHFVMITFFVHPFCKGSSINDVTKFSIICDTPSPHRHDFSTKTLVQNPWYTLPSKAVTSFMDDP